MTVKHHRRRPQTAEAKGGNLPPSRYLVVDPNRPDGDVLLRTGRSGQLVASFHTEVLAVALADAECAAGRRLLVIDAERSESEPPPHSVRRSTAAQPPGQSGENRRDLPSDAAPTSRLPGGMPTPELACCTQCGTMYAPHRNADAAPVGHPPCPACGVPNPVPEDLAGLAADILQVLVEIRLEALVQALEAIRCRAAQGATARCLLRELADEVPDVAKLTRLVATDSSGPEEYLALLTSLASGLLGYLARSGGSRPSLEARRRLVERGVVVATQSQGDLGRVLARVGA